MTATIDYTWVNGAEHQCRCGNKGAWFWQPKNEVFRVEHVKNASPCYLGDMSDIELTNLRRAANRTVANGSRQQRFKRF